MALLSRRSNMMPALLVLALSVVSLLAPSSALLIPTPTSSRSSLPQAGPCCQPVTVAASRSALFSASGGSTNPSGGSSDDGGKKRGNRIVRMMKAITQRLVHLGKMPIRFQARFRKLPKRAKILVSMQMLIFSLLCGTVSRQAYLSITGNSAQASNKPQVELPYSTFLDLVEASSPHSKLSNAPSSPVKTYANAFGKKASMKSQLSVVVAAAASPPAASTASPPAASSSSTESTPSIVVDSVRIGTDRVAFRLTKLPETENESPESVVAYSMKVPASPELMGTLRDSEIPFAAMPVGRANAVGTVVRSCVLLFYALILFRMYRAFNGNSGGDSGDTPGKLASSGGTLASFTDIQGIDNAKAEVMELVDTLRNPKKYAILGARAPTGLLLEGPPGTGKTMLARATAAAAGVPLLYCSGSDFIEMYVGRGAARVRKLFERASKLSPCIIFVDELDALGKSRDFGGGFSGRGGNDEAEQTLNQLLACMDGLDSTRQICVLAATNRKEVLDPALIRPGRFDRIVKLELPDATGRENILRVHTNKLPGFTECSGVDDKRPGSLGKGAMVDLSAVAAVTEGLSGAELEFLVNEAAIRAVRRVSSALQQGNEDITAHVKAEDFETSLKNFYATRKPQEGIVADLIKNVWK